MAETNVPRSKRHGTFTFYDDDGTNSFAVSVDEGDLSINGIGVSHQAILDRGVLSHLIKGDDTPIDFSFTARVLAFDNAPNLLEVVSGNASGWVYAQVDTVGGRFFTAGIASGDRLINDVETGVPIVQCEYVVTDPGGSGEQATLYLLDSVCTASMSEGLPSTITVNGISYLTADLFIANTVTT